MVNDEQPANAVAELLERRSCSDRLALLDGSDGSGVTWFEVRDQAARWADAADWWRRAAGGRRPGPVGLALDDPVAMAANFVAAVAAGVVVAPLDPRAPAGELRKRMDDLGIAVLVTSPGSLDAPGAEAWTAGRRDLRPVGGEAAPAAALPPSPAGVAAVMASSGTTGDPKVIPLTAAQLVACAEGVAEALELTPGDRGYCPLPLFHINGLVVGVLSALVAGSSVALDGQFSRRRFWRTVGDRQATWVNLVPAILAILAADETPPDGDTLAAAGRLRLARSASAPLPHAVRERFESRWSVPILETYGMTEAASQITANRPGANRPGSTGRPVRAEVQVMASGEGPARAEEPGRVRIRGPIVTDHYWSLRNSTWSARPATDADGWLETGDLGWMDEGGYLYLAGREGDVINRGGEKIQPREVEEVLLTDPRVAAAVVVGLPHPVTGEEPVAFVLADPDSPGISTLAEDLTQRCAGSLSRFKRPAEIRVSASLPAGPTGKVRRAEIRAAVCDIRTRREAPRPAVTREPVGPDGDAPAPPGLSLLMPDLPHREVKPRSSGLTMVIDNGIPTRSFADAVESNAGLIDVVKFGWGTALVTADLEQKLAVLGRLGIPHYFGGTLFEKFVRQGRFESFLALCRLCGCRYVEISNGTIPLAQDEKDRYIRECSEEFLVLSEVGFKDAERSAALTSAELLDAVQGDLAAGAHMIITEARESGRSGLCRPDGTPREDLLDPLLAAGADPDRIIFEAPTKELQTYFVKLLGPNVNLGNVAPAEVIGVETLRLGLRSDTLMFFEPERSSA